MSGRNFSLRRLTRGLTIMLTGLGLGGVILGTGLLPAQAYVSDNLMIYLDASKSASYAGSGTTWTDISGSNRNGTLSGPVTYDAGSQTMQFPGGSNGTAYVDLDGDFNNFSTGLTIEFEGEFGVTRSSWERIFDFALGSDADAVSNINDAFWVGQFSNSNELTLETWIGGVNQGRCHTSVSGGALGTPGDRTLHKWVLTLDGSVCRIYKDGAELPTKVRNANDTADTPEQANGSSYPLPAVTSRPSAFLGRSNFHFDQDLEGSIRYIRIYNAALTPEQVSDNANNSAPSDVPAAVDVSVDAQVGDKLSGQIASISGSGLKASSSYDLTMHSDPLILDQGTTDSSGTFSNTITLPVDVCNSDGVHELTLTALDANDATVTDSVWVQLATDCTIVQISDTAIAPAMPDTGLSLRVSIGVTIGALLLFGLSYVFFISRSRLQIVATNARVAAMLHSLNERLRRIEQRDRVSAYRRAARKRRGEE